MSNNSGVYPLVGVPTGSPWESLETGDANGLPQFKQGALTLVSDPWYGGRELIFAKAAAAISAGTLVAFTPAFDAALGAWSYEAVALPTTANTGAPYGVAIHTNADNDFAWFGLRGVFPVRSDASIAAGAAIGVSATTAGNAAANSAGRQLLNARVAAPATTTFTRPVFTQNGSTTVRLNDDSGIIVGMTIAGTGIPAGATVTALEQSGLRVTISAAATASGQVTATFGYNLVGGIMNLVHLNGGNVQGAIT